MHAVLVYRLVETSNGIPRPRPEDFEEKESDEIDYRKLYAQKNKAEKSGMTINSIITFTASISAFHIRSPERCANTING